MNWPAIAFDWNQARAFLATAEEGSLSAAARALKLTQPTLGRQVAALERALGVTLFERAGRGLTLTRAGLELLEPVRAMAEAAGRLSLAASGQSQAIEGHVCITASDALSAYVLPSLLGRLREVAPGIEIELLASNEVRDLRQREADIAIRHVRPEQPELIARRLRESSAHLYASRAYLAARGRPRDAAALAAHAFIGFDRPERLIAALNGLGLSLGRENLRLASNSGIAAWEMAKRGLGICAMMREVAEATPEMEQVLPELPPIPVPMWLTTHRELHTSRRIRLVYDFLAEALG